MKTQYWERIPVRTGLALFVCGLLTVSQGCGSSTAQTWTDLFEPGTDWTPVATDRHLAPGVKHGAWEGPDNSSLVLFESLPAPGLDADAARTEVVYRMMNLPGIEILDDRVIELNGIEAARVELTGMGAGDRLAPSGSGVPVLPEGGEPFPTARVEVIVPTPGRRIHFLWHAPAAQLDQLNKAVDAQLATIKADHPLLRDARRPDPR